MVTALHSVRNWLPLTQYWLYVRIRHVSPEVRNEILCRRVLNQESFPHEGIHAHAPAGLSGYLQRLWQKMTGRDYQTFKRLWINRVSPSLMHSHFGDIAWEDSKLIPDDLPHVTTFYGFDVHMLPHEEPMWLERYQELFQRTDRVVVEGPYMADSLVRLGCPEEKAVVQRLGVECDEIPFKQRKLRPDEPFRVLLVGAFNEKKGLPYALRALAAVAETRDIDITIIGDATAEKHSREEKKRILEAADSPALQGNITWLGFTSHDEMMRQAYRHHCFLSPSVHAANGDCEGGAPVTVIEMAASGLPVVSTEHCDIPDVLENGVSGLLAEERNTEQLVDYLHCIAAQRDRAEELASNARQRVESRHGARTQGEALARLYRELVNG